MADKESLVRRMADKMAKLDTKLSELRSTLDAKGEKARERYAEEYEKLKGEREALEGKMNKLKEAGTEAWKDLRSGLEKGFKELGKSLGQARKHFRKEKDVEPPAPEKGA